MFDRGCDWYCDGCGVRMNRQLGFTTITGRWRCRKCGRKNDVSKKNIVPKSGSKGWVFKKTHNDGTVEKVRYTKTREIREFDGKNGKMTFWSKRK